MLRLLWWAHQGCILLAVLLPSSLLLRTLLELLIHQLLQALLKQLHSLLLLILIALELLLALLELLHLLLELPRLLLQLLHPLRHSLLGKEIAITRWNQELLDSNRSWLHERSIA